MNKREKRVLLSSDKTSNTYWIQANEYSQKLDNAITSEYKKDNNGLLEEVNTEAAAIAKYFQVEERAKPYQETNAYITIKDHKKYFVPKTSKTDQAQQN